MTRQHRKRLEWERQQQQTQELKAETKLPPGLPGEGAGELLSLLEEKTRLQQHLQSMQDRPVQVSIDALGQQWIFVVRGMKPPIAWWADYPIFWVDSRPVWAPTTGA